MEEVRAYQLHLVEQKYSWTHINQVACALRSYAFQRIMWCPGASHHYSMKSKGLAAKWDLDRTIESHSVFLTRSHRVFAITASR
jgi:hypothetical protein